MSMQDRDLDELFRSKLDSLEAAPSAGVWANISTELDGPKQRKSITPLLRVAASVIILISVGLFFWPKKQLIINTPKNNRLAINQPVKRSIVSSPANLQQTKTIVQLQAVNAKLQQVLTVVHRAPVQQTAATAGQTVTADPTSITDPVINQQQVLAAASNTNISVSKPVVPDNSVPLTDKTSAVTPDIITKPAVTLAAITYKDVNPTPAKKHKIHGLGGFINAVVGVVDKRADKIIEFTDTDEGNTVTGINLGIITVKKNQ